MTRPRTQTDRLVKILELRQELEQQLVTATCIVCGCDEENACDDSGKPCAWAFVDPTSGEGICTVCVRIPVIELAMRAGVRR